MNYFRRYFNDTRKYAGYAWEAAKADLKAEVAGSRLSWLWWILDPLLFMLIYTFVSLIVFERKQEYLAAFIFIGLSCWKFFSGVVNGSTKLISGNVSIISRVYVPKYVLLYIQMEISAFKMMISFMLVAVAMALYRIKITFKIFYFIPLILTLMVLTFGISTILMHFGVYIQDLSNVMSAVLRLVFYMSGVFYAIEKIPEPFRTILLNFNPVAGIMDGLRSCMLYGETPHMKKVAVWFVMGLILSAVGVVNIYKNENSYVKAI